MPKQKKAPRATPPRALRARDEAVEFELDLGKWRIRIGEHELVQAIRHHPIRAGVVAAAMLLFVGTVFLTRHGEAETAVFYPSTCLGGWKDPGNAAGEPATAYGQADLITEENAASLVDTEAQMFCGGFDVSAMPTGTKPARITLVPYWRITDKPLPKEEPVIVEGSSSASLEDEEATEESSSTTTDSTQAPEPEIEQIPEAESPDTTPEPSPQAPPAEPPPSEPTPSELPADEPPAPEPESEPTPEEPAAEPSAEEPPTALRHFINIARAQEATSSLITVPEALEASSSISSVITETLTAPFEAASDPAETSVAELRYSLDGDRWNILGTVTRTNWEDAAFALPILDPEWSNVADIQIRIAPITGIDPPPSFYIDGFRLDVEYQAVVEAPAITSAEAVDPSLLRFEYAVVSDLPATAVITANAEGNGKLVLSRLPEGTLSVYKAGEEKLSFTTGVGNTDIDLEAYFFAPGAYVGVLTREPSGCAQFDLATCKSHPNTLGTFSFAVGIQKKTTETASTTATGTPATSSAIHVPFELATSSVPAEDSTTTTITP